MNVAVISLGCDKNTVDTEMMLGILEDAGHKLVYDETEADAVVINTCAFILDAKKESIDTILECAALKEKRLRTGQGGPCYIIVAGCLGQRYRDEIIKDIPEVDAILGVQSFDKVARTLIELDQVTGRTLASDIADRTADRTAAGRTIANEAAALGYSGEMTCADVADKYGMTSRSQAASEPTGDSKEEPADHTSEEPADHTSEEPTGDIPGEADGLVVTRNARMASDKTVRTGDSDLPDRTEPAEVSSFRHNAVVHMAALNEPPVSGRKRLLTTPMHYAYMKIAEGCNKACTYCSIPGFKGRYRSVPMETLIGEAEDLADRGVRELILVAQETTLYGIDLYGSKKLPELIRKLADIDGIEHIRLMYCYPEEITDELIELMKSEPKLFHYIDMPIQHASDTVLKRMGRRADEASLRELIGRLRSEVPDICIRTTLISGFPGETRKDHKILKDFIRDMDFDRLGVFAFSPEEGTPAAGMKGQIPAFLKNKRMRELMKLQQKITFEKNEQLTGAELDVMIQGYLPEDDICVARSYRDAPDVDGCIFVEADHEYLSGTEIKVKITGSKGYDLLAEPLDAAGTD